MRSLYGALVAVARRFFGATGIPVPRGARRLHVFLATPRAHDGQVSLREEVEALARAVERLETRAYIDEIGRRPD